MADEYDPSQDYEYVVNRYHVPAQKGRRVRLLKGDGSEEAMGTIVKAAGQYIRIRLDGEKYVGNYHPTWNLEYLDDNGNVIASFRGD